MKIKIVRGVKKGEIIEWKKKRKCIGKKIKEMFKD